MSFESSLSSSDSFSVISSCCFLSFQGGFKSFAIIGVFSSGGAFSCLNLCFSSFDCSGGCLGIFLCSSDSLFKFCFCWFSRGFCFGFGICLFLFIILCLFLISCFLGCIPFLNISCIFEFSSSISSPCCLLRNLRFKCFYIFNISCIGSCLCCSWSFNFSISGDSGLFSS